MEKNEVIGCYNRGKHYVETCLEQIASLEKNNAKELRQALRGTYMVEVSYKAAENFAKVCGYVINGEDGADKLKGKLYDLKDKVKQLYDSADKHNLITIREISDSILREIGEVEEWADDTPDTGKGIVDINKKLTKDDIIEKLKNIKLYEPLNPEEPINYKEYYKRLCDGGVIDSGYTIDLFRYCVERADISMIVAKSDKRRDSKKGFARLFMNDVASVFSNAAEYRRAAAKSFGLGDNTNVGSVGGDTKINYQELMKGLFKTNWQSKR